MEKAAVTSALVSRLIASQFPQWAELPVRPVERDGWDNTTFRLGQNMSVRLPSAERYASQVDKEYRWLPLLAHHLPLPIPEPLAKGVPGCGYPWPWSIYRWLDGEHATIERVTDLRTFAAELAAFLVALYRIDPAGGPLPGEHNFFRGGPLTTYDSETSEAIAALGDSIDTRGAVELWQQALDAKWQGSPVWLHGDVSPTNLLVNDGRLSAVIDFGCLGVGDPACDVAIAWTFFSGDSRQVFRSGLEADDAIWARGRGWALWKALITLTKAQNRGHGRAAQSRHVIDELLARVR